MKTLLCMVLALGIFSRPLWAEFQVDQAVQQAMQADIDFLDRDGAPRDLLKARGGRTVCRTECTDYIYNKNTCQTICDDDGSSSSSSGGGGAPSAGRLLIGLLVLGLVLYLVSVAADEASKSY